MKKFVKHYIGKGKRNAKLENVTTVTINMDLAEQFIFEYEGRKFLKFEVAQRREADNYGKTHNVYVQQREETEVKSADAVAEPKAKGRKKQS